MEAVMWFVGVGVWLVAFMLFLIWRAIFGNTTISYRGVEAIKSYTIRMEKLGNELSSQSQILHDFNFTVKQWLNEMRISKYRKLDNDESGLDG